MRLFKSFKERDKLATEDSSNTCSNNFLFSPCNPSTLSSTVSEVMNL